MRLSQMYSSRLFIMTITLGPVDVLTLDLMMWVEVKIKNVTEIVNSILCAVCFKNRVHF